jgi:uncharacterized membrane protein YeaQ/YmgE (transglycosylase-associated protein family)
MGILAWIVLGGLSGLIAEKLTGERLGVLVAIVVGIVGALLGGFLAKQLFHVQTLDTFFNASTWITAIIGAVLLMLVVRALGARRGVGRG